MSDIEEIIQKFKEKTYFKKMGNKNIAKRLHKKVEDVIAARKIINGEPKKLKVLIFDLETAPMKAYVWGRWNQNISLDATISEWFIICWSAKWLYSDEVLGDVLTKEEILQEDDSRVVKSLYDIINKADIIVAHNGNRADIPWMNTRFILNGLGPTKPYFSIDTCSISKKNFGFSSNKLDALATYFGFSNKIETSFKLWKGCLNGDEESLKYMLEYNKMDVKILEEVYLKLRPWIKNHPNMSNLLDEDCCPFCGKNSLKEVENEYYYTNVNKYKLYRCDSCKGVSRGRKAVCKSNTIVTTNTR